MYRFWIFGIWAFVWCITLHNWVLASGWKRLAKIRAPNTRPPLKVDMPILTCLFFTFNWLTLNSEMHFVQFHPEVASCLLSRGKRKYVPLGMRLLWKYIRNYFLVYHLTSHFLLYLQNYKEFEAEILDLQIEKYGLAYDMKRCTTSGWALGDENAIGIRSFKNKNITSRRNDLKLDSSSNVKHVFSAERAAVFPFRLYATIQKRSCRVPLNDQ